MARMIDCQSLEEINQIFDALIISCSTRKIYPEIKDYITKLENFISFKKEQIYFEFRRGATQRFGRRFDLQE